jgi:hypothetical protein
MAARLQTVHHGQFDDLCAGNVAAAAGEKHTHGI